MERVSPSERRNDAVSPLFLQDDGSLFDWEHVFGREARRVLDIGCGNGHYLLAAARTHPEVDHLGIERVAPLLERAAAEAATQPLANLRFVLGDAVSMLNHRFAARSLDEIHVYHPQPYVDPQEVSLGMLTDRCFAHMRDVLKPEGILFLQTDSRPYAKYLFEAARLYFRVERQDGPWPDAPRGRTRREVVAMQKKLTIARLRAFPLETPLAIPPPLPYFERSSVRERRQRKRPGEEASGERKPK